jgi:signal transduction histidine kinase
MLSRLGIRQKLGVLLVIPLLAVAAVLVPFTAERVSDARSAGVTARTADIARQVGALIQALQQERLLTLGYLATSSLDRSALLSQSQEANNDEDQLQSDPVAGPVIAVVSKQLSTLDNVRAAVLDRRISPQVAYDAYRVADLALLNTLHLDNPAGADAAGLGPLGSLDALMRSNEEASSVAALLVAAAADPAFSRPLLAAGVVADQQYLARFRDLGDQTEVSLVDTVDTGAAATRLRQIIDQVSVATQKASIGEVSDALTAAITYTALRRLAQDRAAREITTEAQSRAKIAQVTAWTVAVGAAVLFTLVVGLGLMVSGSISRPLRRLTRAARVVADLARAELVRVADSDAPDPVPPRLAAVDVASADEIGELATALNRVQATAALLLERQTTSRRNVGVMFTNIARRTQNLVGRQLTLIDDLERNERSPELLQRLYRLDHVATRLRRSADSLLVVSGEIDPLISGSPTALADVIRASLAEIEGYRAVQLEEICSVAVAASLVSDLRLLLAELLENATNFSPPTSKVSVTARMEGDDCHIAIVDNGLGMSPNRLEEENRRLVERERLELAPTNVLGLFVVGRLARRHGLGVRLDPTAGRGITALVRIPGRLLNVGPVAGLPAAPMRTRPAPHPAIAAIDAVEVDDSAEPFGWFEPGDDMVAITSVPDSFRPADTVSWADASGNRTTGPVRATVVSQPNGGVYSSTAGGASLPSVDTTGSGTADDGYPNPASARPSNVDEFPGGLGASPPRRQTGSGNEADDRSSAIAEAAAHGGLVRRIPGTHLAESIRETEQPPVARRGSRDPEAERAALNDYLSGIARGDHGPEPVAGQE